MHNFDCLLNYIEQENEKKGLTYYAEEIRPKIKELFKKGDDGTTIINGTIFVSKDEKAVEGYDKIFGKDRMSDYI
jgi:hypothetical protein